MHNLYNIHSYTAHITHVPCCRQCEDHTSLCKSWALKQSQDFTRERQVLLEERRRLERAQSKLYSEQEQLNIRVRKVEDLIERSRIKE